MANRAAHARLALGFGHPAHGFPAAPVARWTNATGGEGTRAVNVSRMLRSCGVPALIVLFASAQSPATSDPSQAWCKTIPLPRADLPSLRSNVDTQTIHHPRALPCRPLDVRTARGTLRLAVADDAALREHGLMNVPFVPAGQGMLFSFPDGDQARNFWMKNTIASLDMLFVDAGGTITSIAANVPATATGTPDDQVARRDGVGRYVIELAAGDAARLGLRAGDRLSIPPVGAR
jgi:uncharacterized membrane protein (UPF0127 family)